MIYNINIINKKPPHTSIVIKVELPFNSNPNDFYDELYKNRISHGFIRGELKLPDDIKIKMNGTFKRKLIYLDEKSNVGKISFKIQTAAWMDAESGKWQYVSIFPCFIKKYCPLSLHLLENLSSRVRKGDKIFDHIDDPENIFDSEDPIVSMLLRFEKEFKRSNLSVLLNFKYTEIHKRPIKTDADNIASKRFKKVYELVLTASAFFGIEVGALSLVNSIIRL